MPDGEKTGSVTAGVESNVAGEFTGIVKLKLDNGFRLGDLSDKIGQINVFGGELELKYPFAVGPTQAKLSLTYLHWKLPELGPMLTEVVVRGAHQYATDNNWSVSEGLETRLRTTYVKNLELRVGFDFKIENKGTVQTQGVVTNVGVTYSF